MPSGLPHNPYFLSDLQPVARGAAALVTVRGTSSGNTNLTVTSTLACAQRSGRGVTASGNTNLTVTESHVTVERL